MNQPTTAPDPGPAAATHARPFSRLRATAGFIIGLLLLAAAVWAVARQGATARQAWETARAAPGWLVAAALLLPLSNWLVISLSFWVLMRRYGRIRPGEMAQLIGAAWLLNYLPLRPGMIGRVAYHRTVNNIAVSHSLRVMIVGMACGACSVLTVLGIAAALGNGASPALWAGSLAIPAFASAAATALLARARRPQWRLAITYLLRYIDMLLWTLRYLVAFALVGAPIGLAGAVAICGVVQITLVIPLVGNGMGLREWAVGLTAAALPAGLATAGGHALSTGAGLAADLANRAAELVVALPVGLTCASLLAAHRRTAAASTPKG